MTSGFVEPHLDWISEDVRKKTNIKMGKKEQSNRDLKAKVNISGKLHQNGCQIYTKIRGWKKKSFLFKKKVATLFNFLLIFSLLKKML